MPISKFPFGFANGVALQGLPVLTAVSNQVVWVDSATGNDGNVGSVTAPCATIAGAITQINANVGGNRIGSSTKGYVIMLKPSHAETLTAATTYSLAGLSIIGVSSGDNDMPKITLSTNVAAGVILGAGGMSIKNVKIVANVAATNCLKLGALGCIADGVKIIDGSAHFANGILIHGGGANFADGCRVLNCFVEGATASTVGIRLDEVADLVLIQGNLVFGTYSLAGIYVDSGIAATNLSIVGNTVGAIGNGVKAIYVVTSSTGMAMSNVTANSNATTVATYTGLLVAGNLTS